MKITIPRLAAFCIICLLASNAFAGVFSVNPVQKPDSSRTFKKNPVNPEERYLKYPRSLVVEKFDFQVDALSRGKFSLQFLNNTSNSSIGIKVYDVIGNLLVSERVFVNPKSGFSKVYDFSSQKNKLFIVEVASEKNNKIRSVMAGG